MPSNRDFTTGKSYSRSCKRRSIIQRSRRSARSSLPLSADPFDRLKVTAAAIFDSEDEPVEAYTRLMSLIRSSFNGRPALVLVAILFSLVPYTGLAEEQAATEIAKVPKPLKILILGGTGFTGPVEVKYALARGHQVA